MKWCYIFIILWNWDFSLLCKLKFSMQFRSTHFIKRKFVIVDAFLEFSLWKLRKAGSFLCLPAFLKYCQNNFFAFGKVSARERVIVLQPRRNSENRNWIKTSWIKQNKCIYSETRIVNEKGGKSGLNWPQNESSEGWC